MPNFFLENKLFTERQSGFFLCIPQLFSFTHKIYKSFDSNPSADVGRTFSKAFDNVWHGGLINKLKSYGVENKRLSLIQSYLTNRQQRVLLNEQSLKGTNILTGVPQGSVLDPLLFLIYVSDLPDCLKSIITVFANNRLLFSKIKDLNASNIDINNDLVKISRKLCIILT